LAPFWISYRLYNPTVSQVDAKGEIEHPIAYFSQKLTTTEQRWSTIEREAYAVVASLEKFHNLIYGSVIVVFSDHNPLSYIVDSVSNSAKLTRWSLALQEYNLVFRYDKAAHNIVADCVAELFLERWQPFPLVPNSRILVCVTWNWTFYLVPQASQPFLGVVT